MIRKYAILTAVAAVAAVAVNSARTYVRERAETPPDDDPSALTLGLDDRVYSDPDGRFSLTIPAAWSVRTGGQAEPQDVVFRGPLGLEVWVRLTDLGHDRFERMSDEIRKIEESFGVNQNIRVTTFLGRPAIERRMRLFDKEAMTLDLLIGSTNHHVQLASRREAFDSLLPLLRGILDTYTPGGAAPSGAETRAHGGDRP
jgi:hypothetical protein